MGSIGPDAILMILALAIGISVHESSHAYMAFRCGDSTAKRKGRISLNPLDHIDPFGTILVPAFLLLSGAPFLFGWARPVPVNPGRLNNPRRDQALVAGAGPAANLALALLSILVVVVFYPLLTLESIALSEPLRKLLNYSTLINLVLAVFNMIPISPLDGEGVLQYFLSRQQTRWMQQNRMILTGIVLLLFFIGIFNVFVNFFRQIFFGIQYFLINLIWL